MDIFSVTKKIAAMLENSEWSVRGIRIGKSGPLERAELANQIQGFRIPDIIIIIIIILYLPSDLRVALTANDSEHFNNTTAQWAKTRPQHRELRALLFTMSVWVP